MPVIFRSTGTLLRPEFLLGRRGARLLRVPTLCAIVDRPDGVMLIDAGFSRAQTAWPAHDPGRLTAALWGLRARPEDALASQLWSLGRDPQAVTHVVATQLHRDHIAGA